VFSLAGTDHKHIARDLIDVVKGFFPVLAMSDNDIGVLSGGRGVGLNGFCRSGTDSAGPLIEYVVAFEVNSLRFRW
jgi:hypothetical protein